MFILYYVRFSIAVHREVYNLLIHIFQTLLALDYLIKHKVNSVKLRLV